MTKEQSILEKGIGTIKKWFTKERKTVFFTVIIIGLLVHFELYSKELLAYDGYWHYGSFLAKGWEVSLGRFFIPITDLFRGTVVVSVLTTIISLINIAFATIFLNETLGIKKRYLQILVGILLVVTPTLSLTLMYSYTATGYTLAMLFAVLSVYFLTKEKNLKNIILAIMCIVMTLACYQAYLCVITALIAIVYIFKVIDDKNKTIKNIVKDIFVNIGILILGMIIYYIGFSIIVKILNLNITDYSGGSSLLSMETIKNIFPSIKSTYVTFFNFYFGDTIVNNSGWKRGILYIFIFLLMAINFVILSKKIYKAPSKIIFLLCILAVFPICVCSIRIITWTREINLLMASSLYLTILILIKQIEIMELSKVSNITQLASFAFIGIIAWTFILSDNATYVATSMYNNQMSAVGNRIIMKIEESEEITDDMSILILGKMDLDIRNPGLLDLTNFDVSVSSIWTWQIFLQDNLGLGRNICTYDEDLSMYENIDYLNMPSFPEEGSIKIIDNKVVVKLSD